MTLFMAGAKMVHYFPVSIAYHGSALNITVQSYAGLLEFGLTACRRVLSQDESYEMIDHLRTALREIQALPPVDATSTAGPAARASSEPDEVSTKRKAVAVAPPEAAPQRAAIANEVASQPDDEVNSSMTGSIRRRSRRRTHPGN